MKKANYLYLAIGLFLLANSCQQDKYFLYNDVARLQFGPELTRIYQPSYNMADTTKSSTFFYSPASVIQDTVKFDVYAIGGTSTKDRFITLEQEQVPGATNAVAGLHYKAFNDPSLASVYRIRAGQVHEFLPVVILRDPSLKTTTVTLKFKVVANADFQPGEPTNLWRKVVFTDRLSQPAKWDAYATQYYFGKYSVVKHKFMIESTGQKWDQDFIVTIFTDMAFLNYWKGDLKAMLIDYNKAHPGSPLTDEFGEIVLFP
jgi:hypothetical protein